MTAKKKTKKSAKKSAKKTVKKSPKKVASKKPAAKKSASKRKAAAKGTPTNHAHKVFAKDVGKRITHLEKEVKTVAKVQHIQSKTLNAHHQVLEQHHKRIGTIGQILRGGSPKQLTG
jgi:hypothetical protein